MKTLCRLLGGAFALSFIGLPISHADTSTGQNKILAYHRTTTCGQAATRRMRHVAKNMTAALVVTPEVKAAILHDKWLNNRKNRINVDSANNIVHLRGHVMTVTLKERAGMIAMKTLKRHHSTDRLSNELRVGMR